MLPECTMAAETKRQPPLNEILQTVNVQQAIRTGRQAIYLWEMCSLRDAIHDDILCST